ncbi:MAG: Tyrosine-tRNA ligase [Candidatus Levybacteria bacterium GW2011_GWB1_37_8]|nr:MAG: Tyrosine-tRNA ligase [Candidatus Levybacteria bacterium GW2011_GWC2_37_7]KKQ41074.1 MAG: Tyrosine-tRNA ligase [Candidatus Levybacteria bacterium GW2011_GWB1_37_8]
MDKIEELLTRGVANIIPNKEELEKVLASGKKLNVYLGIDPTSTKIHLGHAVVLKKLNEFAKLGHNVTFLIGDFTALVGDTSDKESGRPILTPEEVGENFKTYKKQAEKILDFSKVKIRNNSDWLSKLTYADVFKLKRQFSLNDFISRELIKKRLGEGKNIRFDETEYPVMQGYDSYFLDTDLQIGGTDQTFNMQAGRTLQKNWRNKESFIIATEFLMGTDGRKMSKTWNNAIWLDDNPNDMFAKIMAIKDELIIQYFTLATNTSSEEIKKVEEKLKNGNPMEIKKNLAEIIVDEIYGPKPSEEARDNFENTVQNKKLPSEIKTVQVSISGKVRVAKQLVDYLVDVKLALSKSEAKRLIEQGGIEIDGKRITDQTFIVDPKDGMVIKVGKRKFVKIKITR